MTAPLKDVRSLSDDELKDFLVSQGEKGFRAKQVSEWLWTHAAGSFEEMSSLSKPLRLTGKPASVNCGLIGSTASSASTQMSV